jgi:serine/threonine protein kinase
MIGETLSHFKILDKLGAGGMGEVYRAQDSTLGRQVAIKTLPEAFTSDPERLARFEREAKLLATLNHPHIAQIHALEDVNGQKLLVMELIEGETLADRIAGGPIPVEEAISLFLQIAEGLEAAHEKGVIHRDLKPANVKVSTEGKIKILDFGLAKAMEEEVDAAGRTLPIGTVVTALPAGCTTMTSGGVEYQSCGGNYYRAAFQGSQFVYVTAQP